MSRPSNYLEYTSACGMPPIARVSRYLIRVPTSACITYVCMILEQVTIFRNIGIPYAYGHYHHLLLEHDQRESRISNINSVSLQTLSHSSQRLRLVNNSYLLLLKNNNNKYLFWHHVVSQSHHFFTRTGIHFQDVSSANDLWIML